LLGLVLEESESRYEGKLVRDLRVGLGTKPSVQLNKNSKTKTNGPMVRMFVVELGSVRVERWSEK
jgi:hypothetical protein